MVDAAGEEHIVLVAQVLGDGMLVLAVVGSQPALLLEIEEQRRVGGPDHVGAQPAGLDLGEDPLLELHAAGVEQVNLDLRVALLEGLDDRFDHIQLHR